MNNLPVFIHSLFRSGSTYLFNVFRRSEAKYWCYQESLHEFVYWNKNNPDELLSINEKSIKEHRHPNINGSYWKELVDVWPAWKDTFIESILYDDYFSDKTKTVNLDYWISLKNAAKGRPVFQECRTSGRIGAMKAGLEGYHIYLWRNPWDQWWSYKVSPYFDTANQLIAHSKQAPASIKNLCSVLDLPKSDGNEISEDIAFYNNHPLTSEQSYLLFYMLWCLALQAGLEDADLHINIDKLSDSDKYRSEVLNILQQDANITGIDFSDCKTPQAIYSQRDIEFFSELENKVHNILIEYSRQQSEIDNLKKLRKEFCPDINNNDELDILTDDIVEQSSRARELARRFETELALTVRVLVDTVAQAEAKVEQAEAKVEQAEAKVEQAEAKSLQHLTELQYVYSSSSWRMTAPIRQCALKYRLFKERIIKK